MAKINTPITPQQRQQNAKKRAKAGAGFVGGAVASNIIDRPISKAVDKAGTVGVKAGKSAIKNRPKGMPPHAGAAVRRVTTKVGQVKMAHQHKPVAFSGTPRISGRSAAGIGVVGVGAAAAYKYHSKRSQTPKAPGGRRKGGM